MRRLTVFSLATLLLSNGVEVGAFERHSRSYLAQFREQCMEATQNHRICRCAERALKKLVPPSATALENHERVNLRAATVAPEYLDQLSVEVKACEVASGDLSPADSPPDRSPTQRRPLPLRGRSR